MSLKKIFNFFFILNLFVFIFTLLNYFPNIQGTIGHDYEQFIPNFMFGKVWFKNNFLSVPWFTPAQCSGIPFYADPQSMYYSIQQVFYLFLDPLNATRLMVVYFATVGFLGMYFLLQRSFQFEKILSLLGTLMFVYSGFFFYRIIVGHVAYLSLAFVPLYCFVIILSLNSSTSLGKVGWFIISSFLIASFFHSGAGPIMPILLYSVLGIIYLYYLKTNQIKIFYYLVASVFFGVCISLSKIVSSLHLMYNFQRIVPPLVFKDLYDLLYFIFPAFFLKSDGLYYNSVIINHGVKNIFYHEIELSVGILPVLSFILLMFKLKIFTKFSLKKLLIFIFLLAIPIVLNSNFFITLQKYIPILNFTWVNVRWFIIYIPLIIIFSIFIFSKISSKYQFISFVFFFIFFYSQTFYEMSKKKYLIDGQPYNILHSLKFYNKINQNFLIKITESGVIGDTNNKIVKIANRNDLFYDNISSAPLNCYQAIFGYDLAKLPKKISLIEKKEITKDLYLFSGSVEPKDTLSKKEFNFFNPICFLFPKENSCSIGDLFKIKESSKFEKFISYKSIDFKKNYLQIFSEFISLISLLTSLLILLFIIIRKYFY